MIRCLGTIFALGILLPSTAAAVAPVMLEDFEGAALKRSVWVVNVPNENAAVQKSDGNAHDGSSCLRLRYRFTGEGDFQYLGVPNPVRIETPVHRVRFWLEGDGSKCSYGIQVTDVGGETHQFGKNSGQGGVVDFKDWKEVVIDLDAGHETWGGDKNGKLDYPITAIVLTIGQPQDAGKKSAAEGQLLFDSIAVDSERSAAETLGSRIAVISPEYGSAIRGTTKIRLSAPGYKTIVAKCWKQGEGLGADGTVATVELDAEGKGELEFPADAWPHGPVTLRLHGENGTLKDNCYLQLYNQGGVSWKEGLPKDPPPAAKGMKRVFADDFDKPLSISSKDPKATYYDHKPPGGSQDFSTLRFTGAGEAGDPFHQVDSYLRIRANEKSNSAGILSSMKNDATGITAKAPCYFECRFIGPNAIGTWPAFWLLTDYMSDHVKGKKVPCDELDIIEAYGGEGPGSPNAYDTYMVTPHCWDQGEQGKAIEKKAFEAMHNPVRMKKAGISSTWFEAFHTYGCKITETETIYYCDDIEVGRHDTLPLSKTQPFFFLINLATGGGWPVDLSRYHGVADMYVDFVRVYQQ